MQIVIDIPEGLHKATVNGLDADEIWDLRLAVKNGIPLPKGHGDLVDKKEANALIAEGKDNKAYFGTVNKDWEVIDFLKAVPTIIEADAECGK